MKIQCTTTFLDDRDRFEKDDQRTVEDARGARFVSAGWAIDISGGAPAIAQPEGEVTLDVHATANGTGDNNG